MLLRKWTYKE